MIQLTLTAVAMSPPVAGRVINLEKSSSGDPVVIARAKGMPVMTISVAMLERWSRNLGAVDSRIFRPNLLRSNLVNRAQVDLPAKLLSEPTGTESQPSQLR